MIEFIMKRPEGILNDREVRDPSKVWVDVSFSVDFDSKRVTV